MKKAKPRRLTVRDLLDPGLTASNVIQYVRETKGLSPPTVTIAHWLKGSKKLLSDIEKHRKARRRYWTQRMRRGTVSPETIKELRRVGLLPRKRAAAA